MTIRRATEADEVTLRAFFEEFEREVPFPVGEPETWEEEWKDIRDDLTGGGVFIAEDEQGPVGVARVEAPSHGLARVHLVHVAPRARRQGIAKALLRECAADARARGAEHLSLEVLLANESGVAVWRRLGFEDAWLGMTTSLDAVDRRLDQPEHRRRACHDARPGRRHGVRRAGDCTVHPPARSRRRPCERQLDPRCRPVLDRDRQAHGRFARELSERLGAVTVALALEGEVVRFRLYERGRMVDEYLSVPTYYGELAKGDELALAANPTLVARLTGADREEVRRVARNDVTPAALSPAPELYDSIARMMGLEP